MHWLSILLIGIGANLDNLGIGLSLGMKKMRITVMANLFIAIISMCAVYLSVVAGSFISQYISKDAANISGCILLIGLGAWTILSEYLSRPSPVLQNPEQVDKDANHTISWKESFYLGIILSLNCITMGFGGGMSGLSPIWTAVSVGFFSFVSIMIGSQSGYKLSQTFIGKYSNVLSGLLLIVIGVYEFFA
ncbi:manganese efflux pump [Bacillus sp. S14(2024)]|uniref:manganese efflux pump n=1 Tax=Bacillus sp. S14(2024) TaxID=3162884 RepID=UPI003D1AE070